MRSFREFHPNENDATSIHIQNLKRSLDERYTIFNSIHFIFVFFFIPTDDLSLSLLVCMLYLLYCNLHLHISFGFVFTQSIKNYFKIVFAFIVCWKSISVIFLIVNLLLDFKIHIVYRRTWISNSFLYLLSRNNTKL